MGIAGFLFLFFLFLFLFEVTVFMTFVVVGYCIFVLPVSKTVIMKQEKKRLGKFIQESISYFLRRRGKCK